MERTTLDVESLTEGINKAYANIKIFEEAIDKEGETISEYRGIINEGASKTSFDIGALQAGIEGSKKNILTFENSIIKERAAVKEFRRMLEVIERKAKASKPIHIVIDNTGAPQNGSPE